MAKGRFYPDPPECLSQVLGAGLQDAFEHRSRRLREEGQDAAADEAYMISLLYGGFRRLVR